MNRAGIDTPHRTGNSTGRVGILLSHVVGHIERHIRLMLKFRFLVLAGLVAFVVSSGFAQSPGQEQGPGRPVAPVQNVLPPAFRATNYEIRASLDAAGHVLTALAKVDFAANE